MIDRGKVYAIIGKGRATEIALYADPHFNGFQGICYLTPPDRGHMIDGTVAEERENGFTFKTEHFGTWQFEEVTADNLDRFSDAIEGFAELKAAAQTTEELQAFYHAHYPMD